MSKVFLCFCGKKYSEFEITVFDLMAMVIYFDDYAFSSQIYVKEKLKCDVNRQIGILVKQGACYRCQIQK